MAPAARGKTATKGTRVPHRIFNLYEVADYLHLSRGDVEKLVRRNEIPFERRGEKLVFRRNDVDAWASQRIIGSPKPGVSDFHKKSSAAATKAHNLAKEHAIIPELLKIGFIEPALKSKTKASLISDMVALADRTGLVLQKAELLKSLKEREQMCSTALAGGIALLHPRNHQPFMFEDSFIVLARTAQPVPFGSPDGMTTDLFFLVCCQDDRTHLHVLARLCVLCYQTTLLLDLREAASGEEMHNLLLSAEQEVIKDL
jgi:PTS system nitrogen regulatory IIA component